MSDGGMARSHHLISPPENARLAAPFEAWRGLSPSGGREDTIVDVAVALQHVHQSCPSIISPHAAVRKMLASAQLGPVKLASSTLLQYCQ